MNRKKILLWIGCFVFLLTEVSAQSIQNVMGRDCQSLNGTWNSLMDPFRVGQHKRFFDIEEFPHPEKHYDITFKGSLPVKVPSDWNSQYLEYRNYTGPMWYQRYFYYEPKATTGKVLIHIGAACQFATVYLNGQKLGQHEGGFAPFEFEVTKIIKKGENNVVICVDNTRSKGTIPGLTFGWANYGGITRDVNLVCLPETYIDDYFIRLDKKDVHKLLIDVSLKGTQKTNKKLTIDLASKQIKPIELVTNAQGHAQAVVKLRKPHLWSPSDPYLYAVTIKSETDEISDEIGLRTIRTEGTKLILNGKPILLKGINFHEEVGINNAGRRACTKQDADYLVSQVKDLGCNFVRTAHYMQDEYVVRQCEKEGLLIWEEMPVWQRIDFTNPHIEVLGKTMLDEMISRDKNRCAIILWSVSNETPTNPKRTQVLRSFIKHARELDSSRLITSALHQFDKKKIDGRWTVIKREDPIAKELDVVGINLYLGWYYAFPASPEDTYTLAAPDKPLILSEFGGGAVAGIHSNIHDCNGFSEEYMAEVYKKDLVAFKNIPNLCGLAPWALQDFLWPAVPQMLYQKGWNRKGLLSVNGDKKLAWYIMRDFYADKNSWINRNK